jgi:hypothetical protein
MAVLTTAERSQISEAVARLNPAVDYPKARIFAAMQAIEDWWELPATKSAISTAINTATGAPNLTNAQKKLIGAFWLQLKAEKEKV